MISLFLKCNKTILLLILNTIFILAFTSILIRGTPLTQIFKLIFIRVYLLVPMILLLINQTDTYLIFKSINFRMRSYSDRNTYTNIVIYDLIFVLIYFLESLSVTAAYLLITHQFSIHYIFIYRMIQWPILYTLIKHMVYLITQKYKSALVFTSVLIILFYIAQSFLIPSNFTYILSIIEFPIVDFLILASNISLLIFIYLYSKNFSFEKEYDYE